MRTLIQRRYGNEHDLTVEEVAVPEPGPGEIRVRVEACGANASDWETVTGRPAYVRAVAGLLRPKDRTLGSDVAGIVDAVGDGVTAFVPGDAVLADLIGTFGGFADQVVGPAKLWVKRVAGIDAVVAASLPQSGTIALTGVGDRVRAGMRVLINGAGGGSGPLALQMAKAADAEVWVVDNSAKLDLLRRLGADRVIDYRAVDFTTLPERFDLVLDLFGTRSARSARRVLAPGGRYMVVGGPVPVLLNLLIVGAILALGSDRKAGLLIVEQGPRRLVELMTMVADGRLTPVVGEVAPLGEAAKALGRMGRGEIPGKLVVVPST
jgi:NADPH:quinone reductase-like Zn-dependent oxidoreductase